MDCGRRRQCFLSQSKQQSLHVKSSLVFPLVYQHVALAHSCVDGTTQSSSFRGVTEAKQKTPSGNQCPNGVCLFKEKLISSLYALEPFPG